MQRFTTSPVVLSNPTETGIFSEGKNLLNSVPIREYRSPITIGNDVWIGKDALIKSGIHIGDGAVIGERTIVTHDVEPYSALGTVRKMSFSDSLIEELLESKWWGYNYQDFKGINGDDDIEAFLFKFNNLKASSKIQVYKPEILKTDDLL